MALGEGAMAVLHVWYIQHNITWQNFNQYIVTSYISISKVENMSLDAAYRSPPIGSSQVGYFL